MATIEILGVPHAYELTAPTSCPHALVFIHGWLNSRGYWQPVISRLSVDFQCLSYDLRGFGESQSQSKFDLEPAETVLQINAQDAADSLYSPSAYAQDLVILLEHLNISSVWLIGHSLGGTIALWAAAQLPDCVKGVICINAGGGIYLKEAFEQFRLAGQKFLQVRPRWLFQLPLIDLLFSRASVARPLDRYWARQRVIDFIVADPEAALGTLLDSTTEEEVNRLPQLVSQLKQPVYFLAGADDKVMESKYVRHLASFHRLFQYVGDNFMEIPDCGHLGMLEQPEAVADHIRSLVIGEFKRE
ncbi:alpha/beta hydrolase [Anabaena cylindrica FACHB-243]|uniref:Alpha/beta hydrolase fold protein n=1 Tax=Anabaena cylindrica (strain ATCC 27899 / PCC 7122) TaxID=272123 RepID=K9ZCQ7_ANACC|nr:MULTISPECIES: alpha/beta hydrolase [Anabaena]AFZ56150.1 alpha/beta hydrolase fold protein [Anabaena cylindrica PCC 7122]MBD2417378.1 alpha/beta hydrolase [Anabaena cylindrica FACHB-243]MBY5282787.1 alpha/beta hydrolase [Anabaena sp. CCAP 1446/1C]MBY5307510.1 alpha/beta hydrolase [Anabaena sp. CCAP 1446/1C]MCM2404463.1 alpha/beta hydrolase [Anabaena sp. CCAP 1446/1C]